MSDEETDLRFAVTPLENAGLVSVWVDSGPMGVQANLSPDEADRLAAILIENAQWVRDV